MVLDFHTHAFPDHLAGRAMQSLAEQAGISQYHEGTVNSLKNSMRDAGITHGVLLNIVVKPGQAPKTNAFAKEVLDSFSLDGEGPQVTSFASLHPRDDDWRETLAKIKEDGFPGVKLHPLYQDFFVDDPMMEPIYEEIARLGLVLIFHAGNDDGFPPLPDCSGVERIARMLPLLEKGTTVLAHTGGHEQTREVIEQLCGRNVYFDLSLNLAWIDEDLARQVVRSHPVDRLLFGTDSPWTDQKTYLEHFRRFAKTCLSDEDMEKILWSNGAGLLRWKE